MVTCLDCIHRVAQKLGKDECHLIPPIGDFGWSKVSPSDKSCSRWEGIEYDLVEVAPQGDKSVKVAVPKKKR